MAGQYWPLFIDGQPIYASDMNKRMAWLQGTLLPLNSSGVPVNGNTYLGTPSYRWGHAEVQYLRPKVLRLSASGSKDVERIDNDGDLTANSDNRIPTTYAAQEYAKNVSPGFRHLVHVKTNYAIVNTQDYDDKEFESNWDEYQHTIGSAFYDPTQDHFSPTEGTFTITYPGMYDIDVFNWSYMTATTTSPTLGSYIVDMATALFVNGDLDFYIYNPTERGVISNHNFVVNPAWYYFPHHFSRKFSAGDEFEIKYKYWIRDPDESGGFTITNLTYFLKADITVRRVR